MEAQTSCNTATLAPYIPTAENPWDIFKVQSLYAKLGFGEHRVIMNSALTKTPALTLFLLFPLSLPLRTLYVIDMPARPDDNNMTGAHN